MFLLVFGLILSIVLYVILTALSKKRVAKIHQVFRLIGSVVVFAVFVAAASYHEVGAGQVGIVYAPYNGGIQSKVLSEGVHFMNPLNKIYLIDTTQQQIEFPAFSVQTSDSEWADFVVEIKYRVSKENAYEVYRAFKGMPTTTHLRPDVQTSVKKFGSKYNVYDILGGEYEVMRKEAVDDLRDTLDDYGIDLIEMNFIDVDAGETIEQAIIQKGVLKQQKDQALEEQEKARIEAETNLIKAENEKEQAILKAEAEAEQAKIQAQAEAEAILAKAEAEAEALRLIQEQIASNPEIIDYLIASGWDGKLPETWLQNGGSGFDIIVNP